jgi:hypothetical protein|tara:strand:- start:1069 stop:1227 length:159 start_codon:yes stop_codon:yes gene_type:complete
MKVMLYTYCSIFKINPMEAQHTPIEQMTEMIQIHGEIESLKAEQIEKAIKKR